MRQSVLKSVIYAAATTLLYAAGHLSDLATTYLLSPDLARETNFLVQRLGLGWTGLLVGAALSTLLMFIALNWAWLRMLKHLPGEPTTYKRFYEKLLDRQAGSFTGGILMGVIFVVAYAAIASKLITVAWNLGLIVGAAGDLSPLAFRLIKGLSSAGIGLVMFFLFPYWLNRRSGS